MHRLLSKQLQRSRNPGEEPDFARFCALVNKAYTEFALERVRTRRATQVMLTEIEEIKRLRDRTHALIRQEHEKLEAALSNLTQGLAMFDDDGRLIVCNPRLKVIFFLPDLLPGKSHTEVAKQINSLLAPSAPPSPMKDCSSRSRRSVPRNSRCATADGSRRAFRHFRAAAGSRGTSM